MTQMPDLSLFFTEFFRLTGAALLTVAIELYPTRRLKIGTGYIVLVNLLTNVTLNGTLLLLSASGLIYYDNVFAISIAVGEIIVVLVETLLYSLYLRKSFGKLLPKVFLINLLSFAIGLAAKYASGNIPSI